jgi:hypothetical protein
LSDGLAQRNPLLMRFCSQLLGALRWLNAALRFLPAEAIAVLDWRRFATKRPLFMSASGKDALAWR